MKSILIPFLALWSSTAFAGEKLALPTAYTNHEIEGWKVRIDDRLLKDEGAALGKRALRLLTAKLVDITSVVPEKALSKLQNVTIELDLDYGGLTPMQYHNDASWLKDHGYNENLARCVHIPVAQDFLSTFDIRRMPWVILHELSHAYHDQVLGYEEPRIKAAWKNFCDSGKYKSVLTSMGYTHEHYGLTNQMEFFAEMTESYFGSNDFYPFVAGELKQAEPEIFALMEEIWGPFPKRDDKPVASKP